MSAHDADDPIRARVRHEEEERERKLRSQFDALFGEWLENRGAVKCSEIKPGPVGERLHMEREAELARLITTFPAVYPWMIFEKLHVLEYYLGADSGEDSAPYRPEIIMLAAIKADLLHFYPAAPGGG